MKLKSMDEHAFLELKKDIQTLRMTYHPKNELKVIRDLPIYYASNQEVQHYYSEWQPLVERAKDLYSGFLQDQVNDAIYLPHNLGLPLFFFNVDRIRINKTTAKESLTFNGIPSLIEKCGQFKQDDIINMQKWLNNDIGSALVAHREFIDLRTYVFQNGSPKYTRARFYLNGLILGVNEHFKIVDARDNPRKQRKDSYSNPIAANDTWKVYAKIRRNKVE